MNSVFECHFGSWRRLMQSIPAPPRRTTSTFATNSIILEPFLITKTCSFSLLSHTLKKKCGTFADEIANKNQQRDEVQDVKNFSAFRSGSHFALRLCHSRYYGPNCHAGRHSKCELSRNVHVGVSRFRLRVAHRARRGHTPWLSVNYLWLGCRNHCWMGACPKSLRNSHRSSLYEASRCPAVTTNPLKHSDARLACSSLNSNEGKGAGHVVSTAPLLAPHFWRVGVL